MWLYIFTSFFLQKIVWIPTRLALIIFSNLEVKGLMNIQGINSPVIFVSNHSSELDPVLLPAALPFFSKFSPIFYASRSRGLYKDSGIRQKIYGGTFFKLWGAYPVFSGLKNYEKSLSNHIELIKKKQSIFVFPEGKITQDGFLQPARGGVSFLAEYTRVSIVPVKIVGAHGINFKTFLTKKNNLKIIFGQPVTSEQLDKDFPMKLTESSTNVYKDRATYIMRKVADLS